MLSLPSKRFYPWNSKRQKQQIFKTNTPRIITSRIVSHLRHLYHNCFFSFHDQTTTSMRPLLCYRVKSVAFIHHLLVHSLIRHTSCFPTYCWFECNSKNARGTMNHILFMQHPPLLRAHWWSINSYFIIAVRVTKQTRHGRIYHLQGAYLAY